MENTLSQHSCISRPTSTSAGESSWAMHFALSFLQASPAHDDQEVDRQQGGGGVSGTSCFSSSVDSLGGDGANEESFITSDMVCDDEDDSLQDTACSSAARRKVTGMNGMSMKSMATMDAKEMSTPQLANYFAEATSRQRVVQEVISGANNNEKQLHECNDLRKRGLCLVPLSMLIDYLG